MTGKIYLLQDNGTIQSLSEQAYESEDLLQRLLAEHPDLLAGEQMNASAPRRWLLVSREQGVPGEMDGSDRWSLDHLFLDQDGVPTLVEVKRSSDARIRREVVGQMLDYAANAVVYWPVERIRADLEATHSGEDPTQLVSELVQAAPEDQAAVDAFWRQVGTNLHAGRVRMVFVADEIPPELKRIVEFLNAQMDQAEVLAVQISQYVGEGLKTLVPRVIGLTAEAEQAKGTTRTGRKWDERTLLADLQARGGAEQVRIAQELLQWAKKRSTYVWWGSGAKDGSYIPVWKHKGIEYTVFVVYTYGRVEIQFQYLHKWPPFQDVEKRRELLRRLNEIPGVAVPDDGIDRRPSLRLDDLARADAVKPLLEVFDWVVAEIQAA